MVTFVYTNTCEVTEEVVAELLHTADMFLLPGLTKLAGKLLARLVTPDTVIDILRTARLFNLARLEDQVGFCPYPLRHVTDKLELQMIHRFSQSITVKAFSWLKVRIQLPH